MKILNRTLFKKDKEKFKIPRSVQDAIPIDAMWEDGIFLVGKNKYSKCFKFTDINYSVASREDKEEMFLEYSELLNSFDTGATSKITIINRRLNKLDFQKTMFIKLEDDELDKYRKEYNKMLLPRDRSCPGVRRRVRSPPTRRVSPRRDWGGPGARRAQGRPARIPASGKRRSSAAPCGATAPQDFA